MKVRYTHAINFREADKTLLDDALAISKSENVDFTNLLRRALAEYVALRKAAIENSRIEDFLDGRKGAASPSVDNVLKQADLSHWDDEGLLRLAKKLDARRQEVSTALRTRGYYVR